MKQAVILAGGKGTRLKERLQGRPKPLIDICGVPLLERQIQLLKRYGFDEILILVNHAADQIEDYCAAHDNWGVALHCIDDGEPLGTAGATLAIHARLAPEFLVVYGDTMLEVDLARFHAFHGQVPGVAATLFLHPNDHPHDSDLVETQEDGRILAFHPYPHDPARDYPNLVNAALYWVNREALAPWREPRRMLDFGKDLFPAMVARGLLLRAYVSPEYIKDAGTPERLDRVCEDMLSGKIARSSLAHPQPVVFIDRDGTINREVDHLKSADQFELLPGVATAIRRLNRSGYRCCVITNQPVVARGDCSFEDLRAIHNRMETRLGEGGAFVDGIYICPHHPHRGFPGERAELKIDCDCRKPKTGLIDAAARDFNADRPNSWLVGDTTVDVETARRAGLRSILVETGYGGLDYRNWAQADFTVADLPEAVTFILQGYPRLLERCAALAADTPPGALVLIGGQSRSGKSTLASGLRDALLAQGKQVVVLAADRWLKSAGARDAGVLGRYDIEALQQLLTTLEDPAARPQALALPGYQKLLRTRTEAVETVTLCANHIVIIEGTIALGLKTANKVACLRYHVELPEPERHARMLREYRRRGLEAAAADDLYRTRLADEAPIVEQLSAGATRISLETVAG